MRVQTSVLAAALSLALLGATASAAVKEYQVTGKLLEVTDKKLVIEKGDEKWEIERTADLKTKGKLEAGQKVTIYYKMIAITIDQK